MFYAISDLHFMQPRSAVCGRAWRGRARRLQKHWIKTVGAGDLVILAGDMIAAQTPASAALALRWLDRLSGKKLILPGNHDRWWPSALPETLIPLSRGVHMHEAVCIVGITGWFCPGSAGSADPAGMRVYRGEVTRLKKRLIAARAANPEAVVVAMHYPPFNALRAESGFTELMSDFGVRLCVYGHLHGQALRRAYSGYLGGVEYRCVSSEKLGYRLYACDLSAARVEPNTCFFV